ncbi:MAG: sulfur carrier protein ThiS [Bacteroidota bacterium]
MITLWVNDQRQEVQDPISIKAYLEMAEIRHDKGVAIAVNDLVVPKSQWPAHQLNSEDKITIITATAGG